MSVELNYYFEHLDAFPFEGWFDGMIQTFEILEKAKPFLNKLLVEPDIHEMRGEAKGEVHFHGNYYVGEGTVIYDDVTIIGPVYIGKNCEIMAGALIRPGTIISDSCNVGHGSEVKRTVMFSGAKIASLAFSGDSVIGKSSRLGSGVITANRRFDQKNAAIKIDGVKTDLKDSFFGLILGDSSRLGANCVSQPGTHIGPYTWVFPLTNVRGFIPREKRVYNEERIVMTDNEIVELKP